LTDGRNLIDAVYEEEKDLYDAIIVDFGNTLIICSWWANSVLLMEMQHYFNIQSISSKYKT